MRFLCTVVALLPCLRYLVAALPVGGTVLPGLCFLAYRLPACRRAIARASTGSLRGFLLVFFILFFILSCCFSGYLVFYLVLLLLRTISLDAWTGTLPQPGERYVVCYMCTKVCMLHVVLYVLNHRLHHPDPRHHHHRHRHHRPHHLHLHLLRYIRGGTGLSQALSFSESHIWAQIACLSKKLTLFD